MLREALHNLGLNRYLAYLAYVRPRALIRLLTTYWLGVLSIVAGAALVATFAGLLSDHAISWNDKANMGQFFKGFVTIFEVMVFALTVWFQIREIPDQAKEMAQTQQDMLRQTDFMRTQWNTQQEQLNQLNVQEVLANIRVLAANVEEKPDGAGSMLEVWRSQAITELAQANLLLLRKHSLPALQSLCQSERPILTAFGSQTIQGLKANLRGAQLQGANLEGVMLDSAFLVEADLRGASLKNAVLLGTNLLHADLTDVNLDGADLTGAHLLGANLTRANLLGASLIEVNLLGANLDSTVLVGADLGLAMVDPKWRPMIERSGARNTEKIRWANSTMHTMAS